MSGRPTVVLWETCPASGPMVAAQRLLLATSISLPPTSSTAHTMVPAAQQKISFLQINLLTKSSIFNERLGN